MTPEPIRTVAVLGLGAMGRPMAERLLEAGFDVVVWNRTAAKTEALRARGARVAASPAEAAAAGVALTILADDAATWAVVDGPEGLLEGLPPGGVHVAASTLSLAASHALSERHAARGQTFVAAPVFGRPDAAARGELRTVAAGPAAALDRLAPVFAAYSARILRVGAEPALGHAAKIAGNLVLAALVEGIAEAMALAERAGLPRDRLAEVLAAFLRSPIADGYAQRMAAEDTTPGFRIALAVKDLDLMDAAGARTRTPLPVVAAVRTQLRAALARGWDDRDWAALVALLARPEA